MVRKVTREAAEAALVKLEEIDADAANLLRAYSDYRYLIEEHHLELRDAVLAVEERMKDGARNAHELAMFFERLGRDT